MTMNVTFGQNSLTSLHSYHVVLQTLSRGAFWVMYNVFFIINDKS